MIGYIRGRGQEVARYNIVEILNRRYNGESCRAIAKDMDIPEHAIWQVCRETGRDLPKAKPQQPKRKPSTFIELMNELSETVDSVVFERSADGEGWVCFIDDVPGAQCLAMDNALRSAMNIYRRHEVQA